MSNKDDQNEIIKKCLQTTEGKIALSETFVRPILRYLEDEIPDFEIKRGNVTGNSDNLIEFALNPLIKISSIKENPVDVFMNMIEKAKKDLKSQITSSKYNLSDYRFALNIFPADEPNLKNPELSKLGFVFIINGFGE